MIFLLKMHTTFLKPNKISIFTTSQKTTYMVLRESIREILSEKKILREGLHVKHIARHVINQNRTLFSNDEDFSYETIKIRINRMLLYDAGRKNGEFARVRNPITNRYRKGVYRLKTIRRKQS
jgi:hypothetical protein